MLHLDAITVCINYSRYFAQTLAANRRHFNRWIIVTVPEDQPTINLCRAHGLEYVLSRRIHENGAPFAKGKALNEGLERLAPASWILHVDGDTLLPADLRPRLEGLALDRGALYWIDRYFIDKGVRFSKYAMDACGYFQLWHVSARGRYPEKSENACLDDIIHRDSFPRVIKIPGLLCEDVSGNIMSHNGFALPTPAGSYTKRI